jgi:hypothetical protein
VTERILASATVDMLRFGPVPLWEVTVTGGNTDSVRTYQIDATTDDKAAQKGIDLFVDEMEALASVSELSDNTPVG